MSVILKKLSWSNMFSYGDNNELELVTDKVSQLVASNGSGKSSLSLILQELLYNKNVKGLKKAEILNRNTKSKTWTGKLEFSVDGVNYEIISKRTGATSDIILLKEGKDISEHKVLDTYKKVQEIIGRDFETFSQLTYQSSTDSLEFLKATDTNRKKFLINLFNLGRYIEIGEDLKLKVSQKEKELLSKQGELKAVNDFINNTHIPEKADTKEIPSIDETLSIKIASLKTELIEQKKICDKIDSNNLFIKERDSLIFDLGLEKPTIDSEIYNIVSNTQKIINGLEANIVTFRKELKKLDLADHCYACGQVLDNSKAQQMSEDLKIKIKQAEDAVANESKFLHRNQELIRDYEIAKGKYDKNQKAIDRFTNITQLIDSNLPTDYPDYKHIASEIKRLEQELTWQVNTYDEVRQFNESVRVRNAKIDGLLEQLRDFKVRQVLYNDAIIKLQDELTNLTILRKAFSSSGIVAYKIENVAKQLEDKINYYLSLLSDGQFQVIFRLTGDKLNIVVINNGKEVSVDSLSGGEFSRVQTSVLLAARNTLDTIGGKSINVLFLDEITGVLDDAGKEKLFEVLEEEQGLNVFLISHDYSHPLIKQINIVKENDISYIKN